MTPPSATRLRDLGLPRVASIDAQAAAPEAAPTVRLIVDASELGVHAAYFEGAITEQLRDGLVAEGFAVDEHGQSTVRVRLDYFDEHDRDFLVAADVVHQGRMAVSQRPAKCASCTDDEVLEAAAGLLPALVKALRADPQQVPVEGEDPPVGDGDGDGDAGPAPSAIGPLGISGGVIATLGLGSVIWGAVALSRGRVTDQSTDPLDLYRTGFDHTPRGKVLLGVGIGGVVLGGALLVTDVVIRSKRRKRHPSSNVVPLIAVTVKKVAAILCFSQPRLPALRAWGWD